MAVMNIEVAYIACLFENNSDTMAIRKIMRDREFETQLIEAEQDFWQNYVSKGIEPPFEEEPELCFSTIDQYVQIQKGQETEITGFDAALQKIALLRQQKKQFEEEAKACALQADALMLPIIEAMGNKKTGRATVDGVKYVITRTPMTRTDISSNSLTRLKIHHPDIYNEYVTTVPMKTRTTFKIAKA